MLTYLVVVSPLTVLDNWENELKRFSPKLRVFKYVGDKETREQKRKNIVEAISKLNQKSSKEDPVLDFEIFLTTYELILHGIVLFFLWVII